MSTYPTRIASSFVSSSNQNGQMQQCHIVRQSKRRVSSPGGQAQPIFTMRSTKMVQVFRVKMSCHECYNCNQ